MPLAQRHLPLVAARAVLDGPVHCEVVALLSLAPCVE